MCIAQLAVSCSGLANLCGLFSVRLGSVCRNCVGTVGTAVEAAVETVVIYVETVGFINWGET